MGMKTSRVSIDQLSGSFHQGLCDDEKEERLQIYANGGGGEEFIGEIVLTKNKLNRVGQVVHGDLSFVSAITGRKTKIYNIRRGIKQAKPRREG